MWIVMLSLCDTFQNAHAGSLAMRNVENQPDHPEAEVETHQILSQHP